MNIIPKKLLYVSPHLSTGGQPQFVLKQIQTFKDQFQIEVVEAHNSGGDAFVVQKNKIRDLVPLHTLYEDKSEILNIIDKFQPDIIHFHEIPEHFLDTEILNKIWDNKRNYFIISTTHGSFTEPTEISYQPDRYVLVSKWSKKRFDDANLGVETLIWEYPIEDIEYDKDVAKEDLGFEKDWKHVLNVGLFAPGKNQKEIFEVARNLEQYKIKFHFIGNQAGNFESYWKPLLDNKPSNCIVWGERNDVDRFYKAADLFYFSTLWELNPLSVKEALSHKLPSLFRKLHTYMDTYDENQLVSYIDDDTEKTKNLLLEKLGFKDVEVEVKKPKIQIRHLLTTPYGEREKISMKSIRRLEEYGFDYVPIVNEVYKEIPPAEHCRRPEHISKDNKPGELWPGAGLGWITGKHYGCYMAHRIGVTNLNRDYDYTLIFEADAIINCEVSDFVDIVYKACSISENDDVHFVSFANNNSQYKERINDDFSKTGHNQDLAHAYLVRNKDRQWWLDRIEDCEWDVGDLWYNHIFYHHPMKRYTTNRYYSVQMDAYSLLDETFKQWSNDIR